MDIRYSLQNTIEENDDYTIYDLTTLDMSKFKFTNGYYTHTLTQQERIKPYMISYVYYGSVTYENLILLINNISDIWELPVGTKIRVPKLDDLKKFLKDNRK